MIITRILSFAIFLPVDPVVDEDTFEHCKLKVDHSKLRDCYISYPQVSKSFLNYGSTDNITIYQLLTLGLGIKFTCEWVKYFTFIFQHSYEV